MTGAAESSERPLAELALEATVRAYALAPECWELAIHSAIRSLFDFLASRPAQTAACIIDDCGAGLARRDVTIGRFVELLQPGFAEAATPPPPVVAEAIGGGIYELVRSHALEGRLDELPAAVPNATIVALSPFIGASGAIELASSATSQTG